MPLATANGVRLYYELTGSHGDPLVLIHGAWGDHSVWDAVVSGLSENFRVLTYDRRGHSRSEKAAIQGKTDVDAADVSALLGILGLAPAHVVGNSAGAIISLKLAIREPSVLRSLSVHEPPLFQLLAGEPSSEAELLGMKERIGHVRERLEAGDMAGGARYFVENVAFGPGEWDRLPKRLTETFIQNAPTHLDEMNDPDALNINLEALSRFTGRTMLTYGGRGRPLFRHVIAVLSKTLPQAKVMVYPGAGHDPQNSHPREFVTAITEFGRASA